MANPVSSVFVLGVTVVLLSSEGQYNVKQWKYPQARYQGPSNPWVRWPMQRSQSNKPNNQWNNPNNQWNNPKYQWNNPNNQWNRQYFRQPEWQPPWPIPYTSITQATARYQIAPTQPTELDYYDSNVPIQRDGSGNESSNEGGGNTEEEENEENVFLKKDLSFKPEIGYDPYWPNGSRLFDVEFFKQSTNDTHRLCGEPCHVMYRMYGPICGRNRVGDQKNFIDYCDLINYDCDGYDDWIAAYRGRCQSWLKPNVLQPTVGVKNASEYIEQYSNRYTTTTTKTTNYEPSTNETSCEANDSECTTYEDENDTNKTRFFF